MNRNQRIILVLGAIALAAVLFTTPSYRHGPNGLLFKPSTSKDSTSAAVWDYRGALTKTLIISAATACLWLATGKKE